MSREFVIPAKRYGARRFLMFVGYIKSEWFGYEQAVEFNSPSSSSLGSFSFGAI
jgi:hypothetical protein